jgi:hypothetical protein
MFFQATQLRVLESQEVADVVLQSLRNIYVNIVSQGSSRATHSISFFGVHPWFDFG